MCIRSNRDARSSARPRREQQHFTGTASLCGLGLVAQRLLRTLCPTCKVKDPDPDVVLLEEVGFTDEEIRTLTFYKAGHHDGHAPNQA